MAAPTNEARQLADKLQKDLAEIIPESPYFSRVIFALDNLHVEIEGAYLAEIVNKLKEMVFV